METLAWQASAFRFTWNKTEDSRSSRRLYESGSAAFVSLSSRMISARAPYRLLGSLALREGAARAATVS